ncbi:MAG TPA: T9SS type A sorting domain-containing protein, partial [Chitinophagales bacterium]|nr:T9SS type A sorting domain-containing protein [Chitinophagales bacterium]
GKVNACRHANGRDWWIIMATYNDKFYHLFLLTPQGVQYKGQQIVTTPVITGVGQSVFSPDGNTFVVYQGVYAVGDRYLYVYDFDRCLGLLQEKMAIAITDTGVGAGAAISPNSRFLYIMSYWKIYQFDLWATDISATKTTVAVWDGFLDYDMFPTTFNLGQLGPDGKIYVNPRSSNRYFHVIETPNEAGIACNVAQHSLQLPHFNSVSMPHFPYFRLGAVAGSACDSLGLGYAVGVSPPLNPPLASEGGSLGVVVYPNPATQYSHLYFGRALEAGYRLAVYDVVGRLAHEAALSIACVGYTLSVQDWSAGLYVAVLYAPDGTVAASAKIVVER